MRVLKGIHYRSAWFYNVFALMKLGNEYARRFQIAARYIHPGETVIDVCSGPGTLRNFIPRDCLYTAMDASPEFLASLEKKGIPAIVWNLHKGWPESASVFDVLVMVISLSQFRDTSADALLESFKKAARRVVIVEEVLGRPRGQGSWVQRAVNYLSGTEYYRPVSSWYTREVFERLMRGHGYQSNEVSGRYMVGSYGFSGGFNPKGV